MQVRVRPSVSHALVCLTSLRLLHFALFTVSLMFYFITHDLHIHFQCGSGRRELPCSLPRKRSLTLWSTALLSQVMSPSSSTTTTAQSPLKISSTSLPATPGHRTCMIRISVTTPSAERSLHDCSFRSEKNLRAVNKLIIPMKKFCCQDIRRLSAM